MVLTVRPIRLLAGVWLAAAMLSAVRSDPNVPSTQQVRETKLTGVVVDDSAKPLEGVSVHAYRFEPRVSELGPGQGFRQTSLGKAVTGPDGRFSLAIPDADPNKWEWLVIARKEGHAFDFLRGTGPLAAGQTMTLSLGKPESISGTVVDAQGGPVPGAELRALVSVSEDRGLDHLKVLSGSQDLGLLVARTDQQGGFEIAELPVNATVDFRVSAAGYATISTGVGLHKPKGMVTLKPGMRDVKLVLPREVKVRGIVIEGNAGQPIDGAAIVAWVNLKEAGSRSMAVSGKDGRFILEALPAGDVTVEIGSGRYTPAQWVAEPQMLKTEAGKEPSEIVVKATRGGVVEVIVSDSVTKQPIRDATVNLLREGQAMPILASTDEEGVARFRLIPGEYTLVGAAMPLAYESCRKGEGFRVEEGQTLRMGVEMTPLPRITGIVVDQAGEPVMGATFQMTDSPIYWTKTDTDGRFAMALFGTPSHDSFIVVRHSSRNLAAVERLDPNAPIMRITLVPACSVEGVVTDQEGRPAPDVDVHARAIPYPSPPGFVLRARTNAKGEFEIRAMPCGKSYFLIATSKGLGQANTNVKVEPGQTGPVQIEPLVLKKPSPETEPNR